VPVVRHIHRSRLPHCDALGSAREEDRREALAAGFQMHLAKPIDAASLVAAVAALGVAAVR
jgi:CheY-like chemotaxis protein